LAGLPRPDKTVEWIVEDPLGWPCDVYEDVRDEIRGEAETLGQWLRGRALEEEGELVAAVAS
jgi:hypothetical protein